jgi:hypothetical protein
MDISATARYPFRSGLLLFGPGAGATAAGQRLVFPASSTDTISF